MVVLIDELFAKLMIAFDRLLDRDFGSLEFLLDRMFGGKLPKVLKPLDGFAERNCIANAPPALKPPVGRLERNLRMVGGSKNCDTTFGALEYPFHEKSDLMEKGVEGWTHVRAEPGSIDDTFRTVRAVTFGFVLYRC